MSTPSFPVPTTQEAVIFHRELGDSVQSLVFETIPVPTLEQPTDLLVQVKAIALNPVDTKVRSNKTLATKGASSNPPRVLGYDGCGIVVAVGSGVSDGAFAVGDEVYYAGDIRRDGSNQQYQLIDSRLVAKKPTSIDFAYAAALPLVTLTSWEALHEKLRVESGKTILITAGAGGVGSIAIQIAKAAGLKVIATASRPETAAYCKELGADLVINHHNGFQAEFTTHNIPLVDYIFNTFDPHAFTELVAITAVKGSIVTCVSGVTATDVQGFNDAFGKSISVHYEFMFARSKFNMFTRITRKNII